MAPYDKNPYGPGKGGTLRWTITQSLILEHPTPIVIQVGRVSSAGPPIKSLLRSSSSPAFLGLSTLVEPHTGRISALALATPAAALVLRNPEPRPPQPPETLARLFVEEREEAAEVVVAGFGLGDAALGLWRDNGLVVRGCDLGWAFGEEEEGEERERSPEEVVRSVLEGYVVGDIGAIFDPLASTSDKETEYLALRAWLSAKVLSTLPSIPPANIFMSAPDPSHLRPLSHLSLTSSLPPAAPLPAPHALLLHRVLSAQISPEELEGNPFLRAVWWPGAEELATGKKKKNGKEGGSGARLTGRVGLDEEQRRAVGKCVAGEEDGVEGERVVLVLGPPGTGKTRCIAAAALEWAEHDDTGWLLAPSDAGVHHLARALLAHNFTAFTVIVPDDYDPPPTLQAHLLPFSGLPTDPLDAASLFLGSSIVLCSLGALAHVPDAVVDAVPPARVALDGAAWVGGGEVMWVLHKFGGAMKQVSFWGDPAQRPTSGPAEPVENIFAVKHLKAGVLNLERQYRMPFALAQFLSKEVYSGKLLSAESEGTWDCLAFVDCKAGEQAAPEGESFVSVPEQQAILDLVKNYYAHKPYIVLVPADCPAQRDAVERALVDEGVPAEGRVCTLETFQGGESEVVLISLVKRADRAADAEAAAMLARCKGAAVVVTPRKLIAYSSSKSLIAKLAKARGENGWVEARAVAEGSADLPGAPGTVKVDVVRKKPNTPAFPPSPASPSKTKSAPATARFTPAASPVSIKPTAPLPGPASSPVKPTPTASHPTAAKSPPQQQRHLEPTPAQAASGAWKLSQITKTAESPAEVVKPSEKRREDPAERKGKIIIGKMTGKNWHTQACRYLLNREKCPYGDHCTFKHDLEPEIVPPPRNKKTHHKRPLSLPAFASPKPTGAFTQPGAAPPQYQLQQQETPPPPQKAPSPPQQQQPRKSSAPTSTATPFVSASVPLTLPPGLESWVRDPRPSTPPSSLPSNSPLFLRRELPETEGGSSDEYESDEEVGMPTAAETRSSDSGKKFGDFSAVPDPNLPLLLPDIKAEMAEIAKRWGERQRAPTSLLGLVELIVLHVHRNDANSLPALARLAQAHKDTFARAVNQPYRGWPPLMWALSWNDPALVNFLLDNGASPDAVGGGDARIPALAFSIIHEHSLEKSEMTKLLLMRGSNALVIPTRLLESTMPALRTLPAPLLDAIQTGMSSWASGGWTTRLSEHMPQAIRYMVAKFMMAQATTPEQKRILSYHLMGDLPKTTADMIGQEMACDELIEAVVAHRDKGSKDRALVLFFAGPPGHGKRRLARNIASVLKLDICEIDLGQYTTETALFGKPSAPSTSGLNEFFAERDGERAVVLLDAPEKLKPGSSRLSKILLQFADGSYLDRWTGGSCDCSEFIFIVTSEVGSSTILKYVDNHPERFATGSASKEVCHRLQHLLERKILAKLGDSLGELIIRILPFTPFAPHECAALASQLLLNSKRQLVSLLAENPEDELLAQHPLFGVSDEPMLVSRVLAPAYQSTHALGGVGSLRTAVERWLADPATAAASSVVARATSAGPLAGPPRTQSSSNQGSAGGGGEWVEVHVGRRGKGH